MERTELFLCQCSSTEHQLIIDYDDSPDAIDFVCVSIHLNIERSAWKRIKQAVKHVFGYKCKYGHFEEIILRREDADRLQKVVDALKKY